MNALRLLSSICLVFAATIVAEGQITITAGDIGAYFTHGRSITSRNDTGTHVLDIGGLGSTSWNFSALVENSTAVTTIVDPAGTTYGAEFPAATHAIQVGTGASYFDLGSNFEYLGYAQPPPTQILAKDYPASLILQLPLTMGSTWSAAYVESSFVTIGGTTYESVSNRNVTYTVDAYGSMTLPGGTVRQALRLKSSNYVSVGLGSVHSVSYQFLASDGSSVTVVPADTNQPETGVITVSNSSWSTPGLVTDVRELAGAGGPSAFSLDQNYPNPFNPSTNLRFELSEAVHTRLSVFNTIGQEVGVLVNGPLGAGRYEVTFDARDLESGVYFYRMIAGRFFEVKKMILIR